MHIGDKELSSHEEEEEHSSHNDSAEQQRPDELAQEFLEQL